MILIIFKTIKKIAGIQSNAMNELKWSTTRNSTNESVGGWLACFLCARKLFQVALTNGNFKWTSHSQPSKQIMTKIETGLSSIVRLCVCVSVCFSNGNYTSLYSVIKLWFIEIYNNGQLKAEKNINFDY